LSHAVHDRILLDEPNSHAVLERLAELWRYGVRLEEVDAVTDRVLKTHEAAARY
jgi:spore cortex formation protein SpoVR/YcgB (stage V sporulation)